MQFFVRVTAIVAVAIVALVVLAFVLKIILFAAVVAALVVGALAAWRLVQRRRSRVVARSKRMSLQNVRSQTIFSVTAASSPSTTVLVNPKIGFP